MVGQVWDADPVAAALTWLSDHAVLLSELGGPEHISGIRESPWPHLVVSPGEGGDLGAMTWETRPGVNLEVYGDPAGTIGPATIRRLTVMAAVCLKEAENAVIGDTVVSRVAGSGPAISQDLSNGQHRCSVSLQVTVHPTPGARR